MDQIRVLPSGLPRVMLDELRRAVAGQPDMELIEGSDPGIELLLAAGEAQANVVLLGLAGSEFPGICSHLVSEYPRIKVVGIALDTRQAFLYALQPQTTAFGELTPQQLVEAIRTAARS